MPLKLDYMGKICHLRELLTNPGIYASYGAKWRIMGSFGDSSNYMYILYLFK
jgi:hypothetical protein